MVSSSVNVGISIPPSFGVDLLFRNNSFTVLVYAVSLQSITSFQAPYNSIIFLAINSSLSKSLMQTYTRKDVDYNVDTLENLYNSHRSTDLNLNETNIFLSGCYSLNEETRERTGAISLICHNESNPFDAITILNRVETAQGVLDIKWAPSENILSGGETPVFATADSDGLTRLYRADLNNNSINLIAEKQPSNNRSLKELTLCLDWNDSLQLASSYSTGKISIFDMQSESAMEIDPHTAEIWTCAFDSHNPNILYSGADDAFFKATDLRSNEAVLSKKFAAGVCSVAPCFSNSNVVMVGGYDEKAWFFDKRCLEDCLNSLSVSGGLWRAKWSRRKPGAILLCGMRSGYHVVGNPVDAESSAAGVYNKHKTNADGGKAAKGLNAPLCYAADWVYLRDENKVKAVSTSFYEKEMHVWGN